MTKRLNINYSSQTKSCTYHKSHTPCFGGKQLPVSTMSQRNPNTKSLNNKWIDDCIFSPDNNSNISVSGFIPMISFIQNLAANLSVKMSYFCVEKVRGLICL